MAEKNISVRMPDELHTRIKQAADLDRRSFNSEILAFSEQGLSARAGTAGDSKTTEARLMNAIEEMERQFTELANRLDADGNAPGAGDDIRQVLNELIADAIPDDHLVAYVAAQPGTVRAWRCKICPGVWERWADITGPCAPQKTAGDVS